MTAAMFAATVINFVLSSLHTGAKVAIDIVAIRKAGDLILDIDYPLSEQPDSIDNAVRSTNIIATWAEDLPVSIKLLLLVPVFIHGRWR